MVIHLILFKVKTKNTTEKKKIKYVIFKCSPIYPSSIWWCVTLYQTPDHPNLCSEFDLCQTSTSSTQLFDSLFF